MSSSEGSDHIFVMNPGGSDRSQISPDDDDADATDLVWSPNGAQIAFVFDRDIWVANSDGSELSRITYISSPDFTTWSPDGTLLAFSSGTISPGNVASFNVWVVNKESYQLTLVTPMAGIARYYEWSPDGTRLAFISKEDGIWEEYGNWDVYTVKPDGSGLRQLTNSDERTQATQPRWSPDGKLIAFEFGNHRSSDVYVMTADGSDVQQVTHTEPYAAPSLGGWSPDGSMLTFTAGVHRPRSVYVVQPDGFGLKQVSHQGNDHETSRPQWSPDGAKIAFISDIDGNDDIYLVNPDSSELMQLTHTQLHESVGVWDMTWSPDSTQLAYTVGPYGARRIQIISADGTGAAQVTDAE